MTTNEELERAVERLQNIEQRDDGDGYAKAVMDIYATEPKYQLYADLRALLSERAELLATVERMRGALERIADEGSPFDHTGEPLHVRISKDLSRRISEARAALTTGEEK